MVATSKYLADYIAKNYKKVDGWLSADSISQITQLNDLQRELGICGHVGEIGVHHGKLFILLYLLARNAEQAIAIDIFERQEMNLDKSGQGSLHILNENLRVYAGGTARLKIISADSTSIGADEIKNVVGGCLRLISIDGGHLAKIVRHDLNTAASAICDGGVIIVDDYFNPEFPGVSEGVNQFFIADNNKKLSPFFVAMNKIYLTTQNYADCYIDHFARKDLGIPYQATTKFREYYTSLSPIRVTEMFGENVLSYSPDHFNIAYRLRRTIRQQRIHLRSTLSDSSAWRSLRNTALGDVIRHIANKLAPH